ncbi:MAG TPA: radical SAM protein [Bdellovibrionales bacterium]|nr:radical SAM protein [Bdellovibrionales bacterium]
MYELAEINTIHLEVTSKCNASCPMCMRNVLGGKVNPLLPITELSLADMKTILPPEVARSLNRLYMCGNYGDPIMATETLEIFAYLRAMNPDMHLQMFTNGSGRGEDWWRELARMSVQVRFSVDGLADTNALYRRGTKWPLIERALRSFTGAGGHAEWDYIVFRHNEHQVETARAWSEELGVRRFNVKKTARFFSNTQVKTKDSQEVMNREGTVEYRLEKPLDPRYLNPAHLKEDQLVADHGSLKEFFARTPIDCKTAREKSLYISAEGLAFPCCWTANQLYLWYYPEKGAPIWKMLGRLPGGIDSLNAKRRPLAEIVNGPFFQTVLPASWNRQSYEDGRLFVCGKTCGRGMDAFKAQFQAAKPSRGMSL